MNEKRQRQQQQMAQQQKLLDRRARILEENPDLGSFMKAKSRWIHVLLLAGFVLQIFLTLAVGWTAGELSVGIFLLGILGYWKYLLILLSCQGSLRNVKLAGIIYVGFIAYSMIRMVQQFSGEVGMSLSFYQEMFQIAPWMVILSIVSKIFDLLVGVTILCLLAVPKNRNRIKQFDDMMAGTQSGMSMSEKARRTVD